LAKAESCSVLKRNLHRFAGGGLVHGRRLGNRCSSFGYILAGLKEGDEVITTVFTCTATNIPLLYLGVKIRFADIDPGTLNINVSHVKELINDKTKAIVCVHYGGLPCDMDELHALAKKFNIPVIEDAAQALALLIKEKVLGRYQILPYFLPGD